MSDLTPATLMELMNRMVGATSRRDMEAAKDYAASGDDHAAAWEADLTTLKNAVELNMLRAHDNARLVKAQTHIEAAQELMDKVVAQGYGWGVLGFCAWKAEYANWREDAGLRGEEER